MITAETGSGWRLCYTAALLSSFLASPGQSYHSLDGRLKLVVQPQDQQLHVGEDLLLECGAVGRPIPRYQWHRNGVPIPNATKRKLAVRSHGAILFFACFFFLVYEILKLLIATTAGRMSHNCVCGRFRSLTWCRNNKAGIAVRSAAALRECGPMRLRLWSVRHRLFCYSEHRFTLIISEQLFAFCSRPKAPRISVQISGAMECSEGRVESMLL